MRRLFAVTLLSGLLLFCGATATAARFKVPFCPECWQYLWAPDAVDLNGNCGACGKVPVALDAQRVSWFWCTDANAWRRSPCNKNPSKRCCTQEEPSAALTKSGPGMLDREYCPAEKTFAVCRLPILLRDICKTCGRPAVEVNAVERTWYWCEIDGVWALEACPMSPTKKCCSERKGLLLVVPDLGPIAN